MRQITVRQCKPERFWQVVAGLLLVVTIFMAYVCIYTSRSAMDTLYKEFNYMHVFEDGSYRGETRTNKVVDGCLRVGQCND